ncbi:hypothetical protein AC578_10062 [Pseudocercospora eumusae]|uniref:Uncharacterized protein n=1 Tax=Pseudocercospora eumusae TaxID=321146 RepID=A0A139H8A1_9PEZI|nr:hypothetical protein AC578_10062 [Pseudocercospora eumusae]
MAPAPGHDYFSELPLEILQGTASYLGSWDKLKLRTVFPKTKVDMMVATLGELLTTVYVSPTKTSLEHFENITKSPFFAQHIRKLVYIPRAMVQKSQIDDLDECRWICPEFSRTEVRAAYEQFNHQLAEHKAHCSAKSCQINDLVLNILQKGLERLKGLKVGVLTNYIHGEGLNATALWYCSDYVKQRHNLGLHVLLATGAVRRIFIYADYVPFQLFAIFEAIRLAKLNLRNLELGNNLCGGRKIGLDYQGSLMQDMNASPGALTYVLPKLRKLTVSCSDKWATREQSSSRFWKYMACHTNGIQDLTLYLDQFSYALITTGQEVFEKFMRHGNYPSLQKLRIQRKNTSPCMLDRNLLVEFLRRHYDSLQHISFAGVIIAEHSESTIDGEPWYSEETVCDTFQGFVKWVPAFVIELQSFEMKVHRQDKYKLYHGRWLQGHTLDTLAEEMGLSPSSTNEWDFGQAVRKMLKSA